MVLLHGRVFFFKQKTAYDVRISDWGSDVCSSDLRMGDIGRVDADWFVELVGRAKDMIISGGFNVYPSDLEAELEKEPDVVEAAVVGMPSDRWGEPPVGFVRLSAGARDVGDILASVNERLGKTQRLPALHTIAEMQNTQNGKLQQGKTLG